MKPQLHWSTLHLPCDECDQRTARRLPFSYCSPLPVAGVGLAHAHTGHRSDSAFRIGHQLRALRLATGASGGELAINSGVSRSMLSRIERGLVSPSVETLDRIARGLGVPVSRFFGDQTSRTDLSYAPAGKGILVDRVGAVAGYRYELLGHQLSGNLFVEPYLVTLLPEAEPYVTFQHPGVKFLHLLTGRVT